METPEETVAPRKRSSAFLAILSAAVAAVLAGTGAYLYVNHQSHASEQALQSRIDALKAQLASANTSPAATATPTPNPSPTAAPASSPVAGTKFSSAIINLSFIAPTGTHYQENERLKEAGAASIVSTGHKVTFTDSLNTYPSFDAISSDFSAQDSVPQDIVSGTVDTPSSLGITYFQPGAKRTQVATGIYRITGYSNIECGPNVDSILIAAAPTGSGLKYIDVYLGGDNKDLVSDPSEVCAQTGTSITKEIAAVDSSSDVLAAQAKALTILKTLSLK